MLVVENCGYRRVRDDWNEILEALEVIELQLLAMYFVVLEGVYVLRGTGRFHPQSRAHGRVEILVAFLVQVEQTEQNLLPFELCKRLLRLVLTLRLTSLGDLLLLTLLDCFAIRMKAELLQKLLDCQFVFDNVSLEQCVLVA